MLMLCLKTKTITIERMLIWLSNSQPTVCKYSCQEDNIRTSEGSHGCTSYQLNENDTEAGVSYHSYVLHTTMKCL